MTIRVMSSIVLRLAATLMTAVVALAIGQQLLSEGSATLLVAVFALPAMVRIAVMKVEVDDDRVTVHNFWRTHEVAWSDVRRIDWEALRSHAGAGGHDPRWARPRLRTHQGRSIDLNACQAWSRSQHVDITRQLRRAAPRGVPIDEPPNAPNIG